jgi:hypothetical protein
MQNLILMKIKILILLILLIILMIMENHSDNNLIHLSYIENID